MYSGKKSYSLLQCRKLQAQEMLNCQLACCVHCNSIFGCAVFQRACLSASAKEQCVKGLRIWKAELKLHCVSAMLKKLCDVPKQNWFLSHERKVGTPRYFSKNVFSNL